MCGLLGLLTAQQDAALRASDVTAALRCQRHRGPDETGTWHDADVVLGFNRLSIIDLEHSHQPLRWGPPEAPERYTILFNGEIYNYLELREQLRGEPYEANFHTAGDTEVVLRPQEDRDRPARDDHATGADVVQDGLNLVRELGDRPQADHPGGPLERVGGPEGPVQVLAAGRPERAE